MPAELNAWNAAAAASVSGGVTVTKAAVTAEVHACTHCSGSGDAAALVTIESPANTVLWRKRFAGAFTFSENFHPDNPVFGANGSALLAKISANTTNAEVNLSGYSTF